MTVVFVGHGGRQEGSDIQVPPGVNVKFFVDFDLSLSSINGESVLSRMEFDNPNQTYVPGTPDAPNMIPNYVLVPLESDELQRDLTVGTDLSKVVFTEAQTRLCTTPGVCQTLPEHTCSGVLGQAAGRGETDVVFLACRGVIGADAGTGARLGAEGEDESVRPEVLEWVRDFLVRATNDPAAAALEWDGLPDATKAMMLNVPRVRAWSEERERTNPSAPAAVQEALRFLESHGARALADWADQWDPTQWSIAMADPTVAEGYQRGLSERQAAEREELLGGPGQVSDDPVAPLVETVKGEVAALASASAGLTGTDGDGELIAQLTQAFTAFMGDVDALQRLAEQGAQQQLLSTAIGVYQQGADAANALAIYSEGPDSETLAVFQTAIAGTAQWAQSLG